jgi:nicotinate-nucleotide adenylyltransferase
VVCADQARAAFGLERVIFMVAGTPALKPDCTVSSAEDRYLMTVLATADNPAFEVSRAEIDRPGVTYTVDTLTELSRAYGDEVALYFITGADAVFEILSWKDARRLASLATFIAATRPGYDLQAAKALHCADGQAEFDLRFIEVPALAVSSTELRRRFRAHEPLRYLLPAGVEGYIRKRQLYGQEPGQEPEGGGGCGRTHF